MSAESNPNNTNNATDLLPRKRQRTYSVTESLRQRTTENQDFQDFLMKSLRSNIQDLEGQLSRSRALTKERDETIAILNQVLNEANRINDRLAAELVATRRIVSKRNATVAAASEGATRLREEDPVIAKESKDARAQYKTSQQHQESLKEGADSEQAHLHGDTADVSSRADHQVTANSTLDITVKIGDVELPIRSKN